MENSRAASSPLINKFFLSVTVMDLLSSDSQPPCSPISPSKRPVGLLLTRDLIFTSKVTGTAQNLGYQIMIADADSQARSIIKAYQLRAILVDLGAGALVAPPALMAYQEIADRDTWFVAFGSHVDVDRLAAAKAAGCHLVLPRSRFTADLVALLQRCFTHPATRRA